MPAARVRVELKGKDGKLTVPSIASKDALLQRVAAIVPALESRKRRQVQMEVQRQQMLAEQAAAAARKPGGGGGAGGSTPTKKEAAKEEKKAAKKGGKR